MAAKFTQYFARLAAIQNAKLWNILRKAIQLGEISQSHLRIV